MSWTDERVETLKTMWSEGKSASQIAKTLGGVTRNAVIGKVHRLGLSNRAAAPKPAAAKPAAAAEEAKSPPPAAAKPAAAPEPAPAKAQPAKALAGW
ncbi:MAG: GcrA family cell cycle regulator, partial [Pseudomonadota bacterium]